MRTQTKEKLRRRDKVLPAIRGPNYFDYQEFVPADRDTNPRASYGKLLSRSEWGALPPRRYDGQVNHPVMYVNTVSVFMEAEDGRAVQGLKGAEAVRWFQQEDMKNGMSDIRSNFIIDEDGLIYEGRGWDEKPAITKPDCPTKNMEYIEICYIGDFSSEELNHPAFYATAKIMDIGKHKRYVSKDALMLTPEGVFYERQYPARKMYLP